MLFYLLSVLAAISSKQCHPLGNEISVMWMQHSLSAPSTNTDLELTLQLYEQSSSYIEIYSRCLNFHSRSTDKVLLA